MGANQDSKTCTICTQTGHTATDDLFHPITCKLCPRNSMINRLHSTREHKCRCCNKEGVERVDIKKNDTDHYCEHCTRCYRYGHSIADHCAVCLLLDHKTLDHVCPLFAKGECKIVKLVEGME